MGVVFGRNLRRLRRRRGLRQEELALRARALGLNWNRSTVAIAEGGRRVSVSFEELILLSHLLDVPPREFLEGDDTVRLGEGSSAAAEVLRSAVAGRRLQGAVTIGGEGADDVAVIGHVWRELGVTRNVPGEAEYKAARKLGVPPLSIMRSASNLWGQTLTAERDVRVAERAGDDAGERSLQALRGHVTRQLTTELEPEVRKIKSRSRRRGK